MLRRISLVGVLSLLSMIGLGAEARLAPSHQTEPGVRFPPREDLTILDWSARSSSDWQLVVRSEAGVVLSISEVPLSKDAWRAKIEDLTQGWWATYTLDLGLTEEAEAELPDDWPDGDWFATLEALQRRGLLQVTHRFSTSTGLEWTEDDDGSGDPVRRLAGRYRDHLADKREVPESLPYLMTLATEGYFRVTSDINPLLRILSGGSLSSEDIRRKPHSRQGTGSSEGTTTAPEGDLSPEDGGGENLFPSEPEDTPQSSFCNGDVDHYGHEYPFDWDLCTKKHNPHYPSYQIPPHCESDPGCASCQRRTKNIGACCDCCESQFQEKVNCDCIIGGLGGCEGLAAKARDKCQIEGCIAHFEEICA